MPAFAARAATDLMLVDASGRLMGRLNKTIVFGSASSCEIQLRDPAVSPCHARLRCVERGVLLEDLGSETGTFLGGARITSGYVEPGARIDLGESTVWLVRAVEPEGGPFGKIIGSHPAMRLVFERIRRVAPDEASVVVTGETGTGKELIARALHDLGRPSASLAVVNCGAIPRELCESELFGHERGAFTGAIAPRRGLFEEADGGTLFLDEIGELPLALQPKLLRTLETGVIRRVGASTERAVRVRVVAATHRDLACEVRAGRFREDLYHRLATILLRLPPLRERPEDIRNLAEFFLAEEARSGRYATLAEGVVPWLERQSWPGNVRELRNAIRRAVLLGGSILRIRDFAGEAPVAEANEGPTSVAIAGRTEAEILTDVYRKTIALCGGSARLAAVALGLPRSTFSDRLRRYGCRPGQASTGADHACQACQESPTPTTDCDDLHGATLGDADLLEPGVADVANEIPLSACP